MLIYPGIQKKLSNDQKYEVYSQQQNGQRGLRFSQLRDIFATSQYLRTFSSLVQKRDSTYC